MLLTKMTEERYPDRVEEWLIEEKPRALLRDMEKWYFELPEGEKVRRTIVSLTWSYLER